jgi:opacity protein-like surface antigen
MTWLRIVLLAIASLTAISGSAQTMELSVDGSLLVFYPGKSVSGAQNFYGGGGSFVYNFRPHIGLKSEFQAYLPKTASFNLTANPPTVPAGGTYQSRMNMYTYLFGPQMSFAIPNSNARVYGEALFGGAHSSTYTNLFKAASITGTSASNNTFAMAFGGGVDLGITNHVAFRLAQLDYLRTRYQSQSLAISSQNNVRFESGVVFVWGQ